MKIQDYDKENDILFVHWGKKTEYSEEYFNGELVIDFDKKGNVVGIEIFNYKKGKNRI